MYFLISAYRLDFFKENDKRAPLLLGRSEYGLLTFSPQKKWAKKSNFSSLFLKFKSPNHSFLVHISQFFGHCRFCILHGWQKRNTFLAHFCHFSALWKCIPACILTTYILLMYSYRSGRLLNRWLKTHLCNFDPGTDKHWSR